MRGPAIFMAIASATRKADVTEFNVSANSVGP